MAIRSATLDLALSPGGLEHGVSVRDVHGSHMVARIDHAPCIHCTDPSVTIWVSTLAWGLIFIGLLHRLFNRQFRTLS